MFFGCPAKQKVLPKEILGENFRKRLLNNSSSYINFNTVEPSNKGHYEANSFFPCREVVPISDVKNTSMKCLCREIFPIWEGPLLDVPLYAVS